VKSWVSTFHLRLSASVVTIRAILNFPLALVEAWCYSGDYQLDSPALRVSSYRVFGVNAWQK